jgi:probable F420-dependent oxidoreductase
VKIGFHLTNFGATTTAESILAVARAAEDLGFDSVWVSDHVVVPADFASVYPYEGTVFSPDAAGNVFEPLVTLAVVAGATHRLRVGTSVLIAPAREPLLVAKQLATVDALSGGRLVVGLGAGWLAEEFDVLGAGERFAHRGAVLEEWIAVFRAAWREREPSFEGRWCRFPPLRTEPKPAQPGGPPLLIGGHGPVALRRAATLADGWNAFRLSPEDVAAGVERLRAAAAAAGRDPAALAVVLRANVDLGGEAPGPGAPAWQLGGPPEAVAAAIARYAEAGVGEFAFTPAPGRGPAAARETMDRLATEVVPLLR